MSKTALDISNNTTAILRNKREINTKVSKVANKGLSTHDYTTADRDALHALKGKVQALLKVNHKNTTIQKPIIYATNADIDAGASELKVVNPKGLHHALSKIITTDGRISNMSLIGLNSMSMAGKTRFECFELLNTKLNEGQVLHVVYPLNSSWNTIAPSLATISLEITKVREKNFILIGANGYHETVDINGATLKSVIVRASHLGITDKLVNSFKDNTALSAKLGKIIDQRISKLEARPIVHEVEVVNNLTDTSSVKALAVHQAQKIVRMINTKQDSLNLSQLEVLKGIQFTPMYKNTIIDNDKKSTRALKLIKPVLNTLYSAVADQALSANMGRVLNENKVDKEHGKGLSTVDFTKVYEKTLIAAKRDITYMKQNLSTLTFTVYGDTLTISKHI